jgi:hypothetical protein
MDYNTIDDQIWRDEPADDPRVEDGEIAECAGCNTTMHLHEADDRICPLCAWCGWSWVKAYLVRRDDVIRMGETNYVVTAEEPFGRRVAIYSGDVCWMKGALDRVLSRSER